MLLYGEITILCQNIFPNHLKNENHMCFLKKIYYSNNNVNIIIRIKIYDDNQQGKIIRG